MLVFDTLMFWGFDLFLFETMVFQEQAEKSPQLRAELALQQSLALQWVFRLPWAEVQGQSGICSRT